MSDTNGGYDSTADTSFDHLTEGTTETVTKPKRKTPSVNYIACVLISDALFDIQERDTDHIGQRVDSKVSDEKRTKILAQVTKIARSLRKRVDNTIAKFEGPGEETGDG